MKLPFGLSYKKILVYVLVYVVLSVIAFFWVIWYIENSDENKVGKKFIRESPDLLAVAGAPAAIEISFSDGVAIKNNFSKMSYKVQTASGEYLVKLEIENVSVCRMEVSGQDGLLLIKKYRNKFKTCMELPPEQAAMAP